MKNKLLVIILVQFLIIIGFAGCTNDDGQNENDSIPITSGDIEFTIWLDDYNYTAVPAELNLHMKLKNNGNKPVEYLNQLNHATEVNLICPNGSVRTISVWANSTWEPTYSLLEPEEEQESRKTLKVYKNNL